MASPDLLLRSSREETRSPPSDYDQPSPTTALHPSSDRSMFPLVLHPHSSLSSSASSPHRKRLNLISWNFSCLVKTKNWEQCHVIVGTLHCCIQTYVGTIVFAEKMLGYLKNIYILYIFVCFHPSVCGDIYRHHSCLHLRNGWLQTLVIMVKMTVRNLFCCHMTVKECTEEDLRISPSGLHDDVESPSIPKHLKRNIQVIFTIL